MSILKKFGKTPSGKLQQQIQKSKNFRDGKFQNLNFTPQLTEGTTVPKVLYSFLFKKNPRTKPPGAIPSVKTDLLNLSADKDLLVWFGHSSYFIQIDGKKFLIDPVFSGNASPLPGTNKAFDGTDRYTVDDLPAIDYLIITHDHYDHLDYKTIVQLKPKAKTVICGLGVSAHFEAWGYEGIPVIEKDWFEKIELGNGFEMHVTPARHFSGRGFTRNRSLWVSYVLQTPSMKIFLGGDSGYDTHFAKIGNEYGPFDLAILENGQYDARWKYIHATPEEVLQATKDLKAKRVFPVHSGKFAMANHDWNEPLTKITELNKTKKIPMITPMIGEAVNLKDETQRFKEWWKEV
jgi:L-ascorbate metabolism protein UlaG (beta-lactamase superfamily)